MERRRFMAASTTALLAGCGSQQPDEEQTSENTTPDLTDGEPDDPEPQVEGDAEIVLGNKQWIYNPDGIEFIVENRGTTPSGPLTVTAQWFDESSNYIGSDSASVGSLLDERNWLAAIEPRTPFEPDTVELTTTYDQGRTSGSDDVDLLEYELDEEERAIIGRVENLTDENVTITGQVFVYHSGWLSQSGTVRDSNVPPEGTWRFYMPLRNLDYTSEVLGEEIDIRFATSG